MPELPEVETVQRALAPHIDGQLIHKISFFTPRLRQELKEDDFNQTFQNKKITALIRRSKYLIFQIEGTQWILSHLGMTGSWRIVAKDEKRLKHEHISLALNEGDQELRYCDPRRFGEFRIIKAAQDDQDPQALSHLGPEPFWNEYNATYLFAASRKKTKPVKNFIMDPSVVCGIGNIYASESLFRAGISPLRKIGKLRRVDCEALVKQSRIILQSAIEAGGTTIIDFQAPDGSEGWFHRQLNVYGRKDEACFKCQTPIKKITQAGRSSFYCPRCQKWLHLLTSLQICFPPHYSAFSSLVF